MTSGPFSWIETLRHALRALGLALTFAAGLWLGSEALRVLPSPKSSTSGGALEYLAARGGSIDVIVIGSSTVRVHFVTKLFEEEMRKRGHVVHAFAFARKGLQGAELDFELERILQLDLPQLKWVLVDLSLTQFRPLEKENWYKRRVIEWHAPEQVLDLVRLTFAEKKSFVRKVQRIAPHLAHAFLRATNVGVGVEAARNGSLLRLRRAPKIRPASDFSVGPHVRKTQEKRLTGYRKNHKKAHEKGVAALRKARAKPLESARKRFRSNEYAVRFRERIERRGARAAFILAPMLPDIRMRADVPGAPDLVFLDFNDPDRYPELYEVEQRYDRVHLAWSGAQRFTALLAEQFAELLRAQGDARMRAPGP